MELAFWKQIASNNFTVPDEHSLDELTDELLGYIGSSTPQLRLDIAYNTLQQWIVTKPQYQPDQLRTMRDKMLGNIFVAIGDQDTDTVFLRSFSMWILGFIIAHDNDAPFLDQTEWLTLLDKV